MVDLSETGENGGELIGGNADSSVADRELNRAGSARLRVNRYLDHDGTLVGKFQGIADQVDKYLYEPRRVADQGRRHVWGDAAHEFQAFFIGPHGRHFQSSVDDFVQVEIDRVQFEVPRFDF